MTDYSVFNLTFKQKLLFASLFALIGALIAYILYGGIGVDKWGSPTQTTIICDLVAMFFGGIFGIFFGLKIITKHLHLKRQRALKRQFRDLLDCLSTSLTSGSNVLQAFETALSELKEQYSNEADIVKEISQVILGFQNNVRIEEVIRDFGQRSQIKDIIVFADIFEIAFQKGGDMQNVVSASRRILVEKMDIIDEIETKISGSKNESYVMLFVPLLIISIMKFSGTGFGTALSSPVGVVAITISLIFFFVAFKISQKIVDIEV